MRMMFAAAAAAAAAANDVPATEIETNTNRT